MKLTETHISIIIVAALIGLLWLLGGWLWHKDIAPGTSIGPVAPAAAPSYAPPSPQTALAMRRAAAALPGVAAEFKGAVTIGPIPQTQTTCYGEPLHRVCQTINIAPEPVTADDCGFGQVLVTLRKYGSLSRECVRDDSDPVFLDDEAGEQE